MGSLNSVTVGQEQDGDFWTNNPIISNRRTVGYYGTVGLHGVTKLSHGGTGTRWKIFGPKIP